MGYSLCYHLPRKLYESKEMLCTFRVIHKIQLFVRQLGAVQQDKHGLVRAERRMPVCPFRVASSLCPTASRRLNTSDDDNIDRNQR